MHHLISLLLNFIIKLNVYVDPKKLCKILH
jgi:hypothetical protein